MYGAGIFDPSAMNETLWNSFTQGPFDLQSSETFAVKKLVSRTQLGQLWFKVSGRLFRLLCMDTVVCMTDKSSGLDCRHYPVTAMMQDTFMVKVRYDGDGPLKHHVCIVGLATTGQQRRQKR